MNTGFMLKANSVQLALLSTHTDPVLCRTLCDFLLHKYYLVHDTKSLANHFFSGSVIGRLTQVDVVRFVLLSALRQVGD